MTVHQRIEMRPDVMVGKPVIRGTRSRLSWCSASSPKASRLKTCSTAIRGLRGRMCTPRSSLPPTPSPMRKWSFARRALNVRPALTWVEYAPEWSPQAFLA